MIVLGCNDDHLPESLPSDSFVPQSLRRELGLWTDEDRFQGMLICFIGWSNPENERGESILSLANSVRTVPPCVLPLFSFVIRMIPKPCLIGPKSYSAKCLRRQEPGLGLPLEIGTGEGKPVHQFRLPPFVLFVLSLSFLSEEEIWHAGL